MHSLWTPVTPKQVISGASLAEVKSTAYEGLIVKALLNDLAVVSSWFTGALHRPAWNNRCPEASALIN